MHLIIHIKEQTAADHNPQFFHFQDTFSHKVTRLFVFLPLPPRILEVCEKELEKESSY